MDRLLQNAINSIRVGVQDYQTHNDIRSLSAVRNLHAGLLLLAKWVLVNSVPHATEDNVIAIAYEPEPDGKGGVKYLPARNQTIGLHEIHRRFKRFGLKLTPTAKKRLEMLASVRNHIEHRYVGTPGTSLRQTVSDAFVVAAEMFRLGGLDPVQQVGDAWSVMLNVNEVYEKEVEACWATFQNVQWRFNVPNGSGLECPTCESELVEQCDPQNPEQERASGKCRSCGQEVEAETVVESLVKSHFAALDYSSVKETGDGVLFACPSCMRETYINTVDDNDELTACLNCGFKLGLCGLCGTGLRPDDLYGDDDDLCSYCGHQMAKA